MAKSPSQSVTIVTFGFVVFLQIGSIKFGNALQCYQCDRVTHPSDCTRVTTCAAGQFCLDNAPSLVGRRFLMDVQKCVSCCQGDKCNIRECSAAHEWSAWQPWSVCSASCDGGNRFRSRTCPAGQCHGIAYEIGDCNTQPCIAVPTWSSWAAWSSCMVTCGDGVQQRNRTCSDHSCPGASRETQLCTNPGCPVDGDWSGWSTWFPCSATCGGGTSIHVRTCSNPVPQNGGKPCANFSSFKETRPCSLPACATTTTVPCIDSAGSTCSNALYLQYACPDTDLQKLCLKACGLCH